MNFAFLIASILTVSPAQAAPDCYGEICAGDRVFDVDSNYKEGIVTSINASGNALIQSTSGESWNEAASYLAVSKPGLCVGQYCMGDTVYDVDSDYKKATIIGRKGNSLLIDYGWWGGKAMETVGYLGLAKAGLCVQDICVGDQVLDRDTRPGDGVVLAIKANEAGGYYVIQYSSGAVGADTKSYVTLIRRGEESARILAERETLRRNEEQVGKLVAEGILDEGAYRKLRQSGLSHEQAVEQASGPIWVSFPGTGKFVSKLSQFVYRFDQLYLTEITKLVAPGINQEKRDLFLSTALLPYLRQSGYRGVKEKYLLPSVQRLEAALNQRGVKSLHDIESTALSRRLAVYMLAASLQTAFPQMNEWQKPRAQEILRVLGDSATKGMKVKDTIALFAILPDYRALLLELAQNLYLQSRVAVDVQLLDYIENN